MKFEGTHLLPGNRRDAWTALNDPTVLKACIPGCESLQSLGDNRFETVIITSVGPVRARLAGTLSLANVVVNESYTLEFDLRAGAAGFGRGEVQVRLHAGGSGNSLYYSADAVIGGRIAQLGSRLIEGTARKISDSFFERFAAEVAARGSQECDSRLVTSEPRPPRALRSLMRHWMTWVAGAAAVMLLLWRFS
jgi:carbon monoxide dehydrogenase subunit G